MEIKEILLAGTFLIIISSFSLFINGQIATQCQEMIQSKSYLGVFNMSTHQSVLINNYTFYDYKIANLTIFSGCAFFNTTTGMGYAFN